MRSAELASLAGVTVRTLRHYHQVGVLEEPERRSNGYREYGVHDLVRLLRIKRLAAVGISLDRMAGLLDDTDADPGTLLDELDVELASQIDRLVGQREVIARLRSHAAAPDLPPELAPYAAVFATADLPPELVRADRDQSVLLAHLAGDGAIPHLVRLYARLADPEIVPAVTAVAEQFGRLGPGSTTVEIAAVVDAFVEVFHQAVAELADAGPELDLSASADLLDEYTRGAHNAQQLRVLDEVAVRLAEEPEPDQA